MRRKRRYGRNEVFIDLTSLLDVIFILLLVVICSYHFEKQRNEQENAIAQESMLTAIADAESDSQAYTDMIDTQDNLQKYVWAASIVVPYDPDEITLRHIKVLTEDTEIMSFELVGNDVAGNVQEFRDSLTDYIKKYADRPVILSLNENNDKILYRDEKAINEVFDELMNAFDNVYIKGSISEE